MAIRKAGILPAMAASLFLAGGAAAQESDRIRPEFRAGKPIETTLTYDAAEQPAFYWQHPSYDSYIGGASNPGKSNKNKTSLLDPEFITVYAVLEGSSKFEIKATYDAFDRCRERGLVCRENNVIGDPVLQAGPAVAYSLDTAKNAVVMFIFHKGRKSKNKYVRAFSWGLPLTLSGTYIAYGVLKTKSP